MAPPPSTKTQLDSFLKDPRVFPFLNYALLFFMVLTYGATGIVALLIANFREDKAPDWIKPHYEFQKRTFWLSVGPILICAVAGLYLKGHGIQNANINFALVLVPLLYVISRTVMGFNHLLYNRTYPNPKTWTI